MTVKQKILTSIEPVVKAGTHVQIDLEKTKSFAEKLKNLEIPAWDNQLQFLGDPAQTIQYYFFLDSINFCFWAEQGNEKWQYNRGDEWISGYYAFASAVKKFFEANPDLDAEQISNLNLDEFKAIFVGKNELLLLDRRFEIIRENFAVLADKYNGQAAELIKQAGGDVNRLVENILEDFPSFQDWADLTGSRIFFLKRAQIFVSDSYYALQNQAPLNFTNLDDLTLFADYKLPQLLQAEGVLVYSKELIDRILSETFIPQGSKEEIEIRAFTIYAGELLVSELKKLGRVLNSNQLDWLLWVLAKNTQFSLPHHKTLTTYY